MDKTTAQALVAAIAEGRACLLLGQDDTFATGLLLAGVPIEDVSVLLGHSNTRITAKHYSPWVKERQERLEDRVRQAWTLIGEAPAANR